MFSKSSLRAVAPIAQALTANNQVLVIRGANLPLAAACESYNDFTQPNKVAYSHDLAVASQEEFAQANAVISPEQEMGFERQVELMAKGLQGIVYTARNVIKPTVEAYSAAYTGMMAEAINPEIELKMHVYDDVHNQPGLVNHVATRYPQVRQLPEYTTYRLGTSTAEKVMELAAVNNPHLDQEMVTKWLLVMGADRILSVWNQLFNAGNGFTFQSLSFTRLVGLQRNVDEILLAYCLCGHFIENPPESLAGVTLETWSRDMQLAHEAFGALLYRAYEKRVEDVNKGMLIFHADAVEPVQNLRVFVEVNSDVYASWSEAGGAVESLLGCAVYNPHMRTVEAINSVAEQMAAKWDTLYPLIRQAAVDRSIAKRRSMVRQVLLSTVTVPEELPSLDINELNQVSMAHIASLTDADFDNPYMLFTRLVCSCFYSNPVYFEFLQAFERYSRENPEAKPRELAVYGLLEVAASWLAGQTAAVDYKPVVDPNATLAPTVSQEDPELEAAESKVAMDGASEATVTPQETRQHHDGLHYPKDQFDLVPTDEHGEMPPGYVLKAGATPVEPQPA